MRHARKPRMDIEKYPRIHYQASFIGYCLLKYFQDSKLRSSQNVERVG